MVATLSEKLSKSDFVMVPVMTPLGEKSFISETSFLQTKDESKGLNFWSPSPEQNLSSPIKPKKPKRPISQHIIDVLTAHAGKTYNFSELRILLKTAGFNHSPNMIQDNLKILLDDNEVIKINDCFGIKTEIQQ